MPEWMWEHMLRDGFMGGAGWIWLALWLVFTAAVIILVVVGVVWLVRSGGAGGGGSDRRDAQGRGGAAREALDLRYARGEISREEYLRAREDLEGR